jgi:hypothetical protein
MRFREQQHFIHSSKTHCHLGLHFRVNLQVDPSPAINFKGPLKLRVSSSFQPKKGGRNLVHVANWTQLLYGLISGHS